MKLDCEIISGQVTQIRPHFEYTEGLHEVDAGERVPYSNMYALARK